MTSCVFVSRLSLLLSGRLCRKVSCAQTAARTSALTFSSAVTGSQRHTSRGLTGKVDRFGGVTVDLAQVGLPEDISEEDFSRLLQGWL